MTTNRQEMLQLFLTVAQSLREENASNLASSVEDDLAWAAMAESSETTTSETFL